MSPVMPTPPMGTRWYAEPAAGDGWIVVYLGPAEWTDAQLGKPDLRDLYTWPTSLPGLCGADVASVVRMAASLIARLRERFPQIVAARRLIDAINSGLPLEDPAPVETPVPMPKVTLPGPQFAPGERVRLGKAGIDRVVVSQTGPIVITETDKGSRRRTLATALIRIDHS